jgi:hypothetical protein
MVPLNSRSSAGGVHARGIRETVLEDCSVLLEGPPDDEAGEQGAGQDGAKHEQD